MKLPSSPSFYKRFGDVNMSIWQGFTATNSMETFRWVHARFSWLSKLTSLISPPGCDRLGVFGRPARSDKVPAELGLEHCGLSAGGGGGAGSTSIWLWPTSIVNVQYFIEHNIQLVYNGTKGLDQNHNWSTSIWPWSTSIRFWST